MYAKPLLRVCVHDLVMHWSVDALIICCPVMCHSGMAFDLFQAHRPNGW